MELPNLPAFLLYLRDAVHRKIGTHQFFYARALADEFNFDTNTRIFYAFLYGVFYNVVSPLVVITKLGLPPFSGLDKFWEEYRFRLVFTSDQAWIRKVNAFVPILLSFPEKPLEFLKSVSDKDAETNFMSLFYYEFCEYFSYFSKFLFLNCLEYLTDDYKVHMAFQPFDKFQSVYRGLLAVAGKRLDKMSALKKIDVPFCRFVYSKIVEACRSINLVTTDYDNFFNLCGFHKHIYVVQDDFSYVLRTPEILKRSAEMLPESYCTFLKKEIDKYLGSYSHVLL